MTILDRRRKARAAHVKEQLDWDRDGDGNQIVAGEITTSEDTTELAADAPSTMIDFKGG